jgi:hypothetical protein
MFQSMIVQLKLGQHIIVSLFNPVRYGYGQSGLVPVITR